MRRRPGWSCLSATKSKLSIRYRHDASGWEILHCGHPTAIWPYYCLDPAHPECVTMTHNGRGFRTLDRAMDAVEAVLAGQMVATDDRCVPGVRRFLNQGQP